MKRRIIQGDINVRNALKLSKTKPLGNTRF